MAPGTPSNRAEAALNPEITAPWIDFQQPLTALFAEIEALRRETAAVGEEIAAGVEDLRAEQAKYAQLQKEFSCRLQTSEEVDVKLRDDLRAFCERRSPAAIKIPGSAERVAHLRHLSRSLKQNLSDESLNEEVSPTLWQRLTRIRHPEERPRRLLHALLAIVLVAQFAEGTLMFITCYPSTASGALYLICFALASLLSTIEMYLNFYTTTFVGWELLDSPEDLPAIKSKYFRGWFAFDFITAFPWDLLALAFGRSKFGSVQCLKPFSPEHFYSWVHWLRVVQVIRVPTFFKTSNPLAETSRYINVVWGCFILYTALHSLAFLYLLTSNEKEHQFDPNAPTAIKYIAALTWAIQTPVHGIYFVPLQPVTRFLDIVIVVLGLTSVLILSALLAAFVVSRGPFGEERRERGRRLETVIRLAEVPQNVHKSVSSIYPSLSQLHEQDYGAVLHTLPPFLVDEVRNCMKEKYIKRIPMFMDGGPCACSVLAWASDALTVPAQSAIIEDGRAPDALYVLGYGVAELTVINTITGKPDVIANLRSGAWFGDRALVHQATTLASVRSVTTCDLFRLVQDDFSVVCEEFPELSESISRHFREHLTKLAEYTISTTKVRTFETNVGQHPLIAAMATNRQARMSLWVDPASRRSLVATPLMSPGTGDFAQSPAAGKNDYHIHLDEELESGSRSDSHEEEPDNWVPEIPERSVFTPSPGEIAPASHVVRFSLAQQAKHSAPVLVREELPKIELNATTRTKPGAREAPALPPIAPNPKTNEPDSGDFASALEATLALGRY